MSEKVWALKLILVGDSNVGKTSLRRSYMGEKFEENYLNTIGADFSYKSLRIHNAEVNVSIWDLAGGGYEKIHPQYYAGTSGVMVVFDLSNDNSFNNIPKWILNFEKHAEYTDTPFLIIGNKTDIVSNENITEARLKLTEIIQKISGENVSRRWMHSLLTSAKTGMGVQDAFKSLIRAIMEQRVPDYEQRIDKSKPIDMVVPAAYLILFDNMYGPKILTRNPLVLNDNRKYGDREFGSAIKISSVIDMQDVMDHTQVTGSFNWSSPSGIFHYIGFTRQDGNSSQLYILGFVITQSYERIIQDSNPIINGYLHSVMNQFVSELIRESHDISSVKIASTEDTGKIEEFSRILGVLRKNVFNLIVT